MKHELSPTTCLESAMSAIIRLLLKGFIQALESDDVQWTHSKIAKLTYLIEDHNYCF